MSVNNCMLGYRSLENQLTICAENHLNFSCACSEDCSIIWGDDNATAIMNGHYSCPQLFMEACFEEGYIGSICNEKRCSSYY